MNKFYDIVEMGKVPSDYQLQNLGSQMYMGTFGGGKKSQWGDDTRWSNTYYRETTVEDYDSQFAYKLTKSKPAHDAFNFLNYHLEVFLRNYPDERELFLKQIKYVIQPILQKNPNYQLFGQIANEWLDKNNLKQTDMLDGIDVAGDMKNGLNQLFKINACTIRLHKNFNCSDSSFIEMKAMPNKPKNSNQDVFQFMSKIDVGRGDVVEKIVSGEYYVVEKIENKTLGDTFLYMMAYVKKIDSKGHY